MDGFAARFGAVVLWAWLHGSHVEIVGYPNMGLFITPVKKGFNRSHMRTSLFVKPEYLVVAPEGK